MLSKLMLSRLSLNKANSLISRAKGDQKHDPLIQTIFPTTIKPQKPNLLRKINIVVSKGQMLSSEIPKNYTREHSKEKAVILAFTKQKSKKYSRNWVMVIITLITSTLNFANRLKNSPDRKISS